MTAPAPSADRWLYGPLPDLLLGCGALYGLLFVVSAAAGEQIRALQPGYLLPLMVFLTSTPHYGATLLRVYERREDRRSYVLFSIYATGLIALAFVAGVHHAGFAALVYTLYITWSPWHYTGQNYGIAVMLLRRRGVAIDGRAKRLLYASFALSYATTFLVLHGSTGSDAAVPVAYDASRAMGTYLIPLGIPRTWVQVLLPLVALGSAGSLALAAGGLLRRGARLRDLGPAALLVLTQALWFSLPFSFRFFGNGLGLDPLDPAVARHYGVWIAVAHGSQYLWVTSYYARASRGWHGTAHYFGKALLAGGTLWFVPTLLIAPGAFGRDPSATALLDGAGGTWLFLAACINIHHFVLDGAIWKLRSSRIASVLIRSVRLPEGPEERGAWARAMVWTVCGVVLSAYAFYTWSREVTLPRALASGHYDRALATLDRLAFFGDHHATRRLNLGLALSQLGRTDEAITQLEASLRIRASARGYRELGRLHLLRGEWEQAIAAFEAGIAERPDGWRMLHGLATAWLALDRPDLAAEYSERALALQPDHRDSRATLRRARLLLGRADAGDAPGTDPGGPAGEPRTEQP